MTRRVPSAVPFAASLVTFASTLVLVCAVVACGQLGRESGKVGLESTADTGYATAGNVSAWRSKWIKGEWIVTVGDNPYDPPNESAWKNVFVQRLVLGAGIERSSARFSQAAAELSGSVTLKLNRIAFATLPALMKALDEPPLGFAHVRIQGGDSFLRSIDSPLSFATGTSKSETLEKLAAWQGKALENAPGVVWAEPNLLESLDSAQLERGLRGGGAPGSKKRAPGTRETDASETDAIDASAALDTANPDASTSGYVPPPEFKHATPMVEFLKRIRADEAYKWVHDRKIALADVNVAVLDTGVDYFHPDLKDNIFTNSYEIPGNGVDDDNNGHNDDMHGIDATYDKSNDPTVAPKPGAADLLGPGQACPEPKTDDEEDLTSNCGHGSHVAGIIASKHGGNLTTLGVCPSCKIISVRVSERCLQPDTLRAEECVKPLTKYDSNKQWEVDGGIADISQIRGLAYLFELRLKGNREKLATNVVNMSLGKYFRSRAMSYAIRQLEKLNIIVVAAAGNDNTDTPSYPAAYSSVVSVCATGTASHRGIYGKAIFSNFGDWVDICAPGVEIYSTVPGKDSDGTGRFGQKSGTSQATPFVAGAVGYMLSVYRNDLGAKDLIRRLKSSSNYAHLYEEAEYNTLYRACYSGSDVCDSLLGSGFLDLAAALEGKVQTKIDESNGKQVSSGCVVSSIGAGGPFFPRTAWSSMPVMLAALGLLLRLVGVVRSTGTRNRKINRQSH